MNKSLPICSVIEINNKKEKYIIIGKNVKIGDKVHDYCCVLYPYGFLLETTSIYFYDDSDVKNVIFMGNINY